MKAILRLLWGDAGATAVEYAVMLGLVLLAAIAGISTVGVGSGGLWSNNSSQIETAMSGGS